MKMIKAFLVAAVAVVALCADAATWTDPETGITWTYTVSSGKASIGSGSSSTAVPTSTSGAITIPSTLDGYSVTSIGAYAFYDCSSLTSVTIPDSVTNVGRDAFFRCGSLTNVYCGAESIEYGAFEECSSLVNITFSDRLKDIGPFALGSAVRLPKVTIPAGVTNISSTAFYWCTNVSQIVVEEGNRFFAVNDRMLYADDGRRLLWCPNVVTKAVIPDGVTYISDHAFCGCVNLESVVIPDSVLTIASWYNEYYMTSFSWDFEGNVYTVRGPCVVEWEIHCGNMDDGDFKGEAWVSVDGVRTDVSNFLYDSFSCEFLPGRHRVSFSWESRDSEDIVRIWMDPKYEYSYFVFSGCKNLKEIKIPVHLLSPISELMPDAVSMVSKVFLTGRDGRMPDSMFEGCVSLESLIIPEGITSIGSYAFDGCSSLTSVTIPDSVKSIKSSAFSGCSSLMRVTMSDGVTYIGSKAFSGCSLLTSVTIPDSVTYLGSDAFLGCNSLYDTVTIPGLTLVDGWVIKCDQSISGDLNLASIRGIGPSAFSGRTKITGLTIPDSVKSVGDKAFYNCKSLASVTIPNSVVCVGSDAFYNCNSLEAVYITDFSKWCEINFASEESNPIYYADKLYLNGKLLEIENLAIPNSVTRIGSYVFKGYNSLKSVVIPDSVISIGASAFEDCSLLMSVTIGKNVVSIGLNAFPYNNSILNMKVAEENSRYKTIYGQIVDNVEGGVIFSPKIGVEVISTSIREDEPTILDVTYVVKGGYDKVNVRALAFEDGTRSWAKVVRPETFVTTPSGTASVIGDGVRVSVTNTFSWKVSADYLNNLAKLKVEIFVQTDDLLPLDLMTIPAYNGKPALEFSRNTLTESDVMNALYWLYADKDSGLNLSGGILKNENKTLVQSTSLNSQDAAKYVIQKMGYICLTGENLNYINSETRLNLSPSGIRQYAVKEVE